MKNTRTGRLVHALSIISLILITSLQCIVREVARTILDTNQTWAAQTAAKQNIFLKAVSIFTSVSDIFRMLTKLEGRKKIAAADQL